MTVNGSITASLGDGLNFMEFTHVNNDITGVVSMISGRDADIFELDSTTFDALAVSAGFDRGVADWGGTLSDTDYRQIGEMLKHFSNERSQGRRFAILEGGYNHTTLGASILSFLEGFDS